ncbi:MAG: secretin and TonB N-terminal domain-containing protein [Polyangiales bacterium]
MNADLHEVCRLLAEVGKINIVVADDVKGSVTIKMKQVPCDQALDAILRTKGYASEREGNIVTVYAP